MFPHLIDSLTGSRIGRVWGKNRKESASLEGIVSLQNSEDFLPVCGVIVRADITLINIPLYVSGFFLFESF